LSPGGGIFNTETPVCCGATGGASGGYSTSAKKAAPHFFAGFHPTANGSDLAYRRAVMNNTYVIQWRSTVNGRAGRGTKVFGREEAERLADELNQEYPQIHHEAVKHQAPDEPINTPTPEDATENTPALSVP